MVNWFAHGPIIQSIVTLVKHVIGMVRPRKQNYLVNNRSISLKVLSLSRQNHYYTYKKKAKAHDMN